MLREAKKHSGVKWYHLQNEPALVIWQISDSNRLPDSAPIFTTKNAFAWNLKLF